MALVLHMGIAAVNAACYTSPTEQSLCESAPCDACAVHNGQKAKIQSVTFVYQKDQPANLDIANYNPATSTKHVFTAGGAILSGGSVNIVCSSRSPDVTFNNVLDGESITINVGSSGAEQQCTLTDNLGNSQHLVIHTSCSAPIGTNDRWGALTLTAFTGTNTGVCSPPCQACCDTAPAVTPVTNANVYSVGSVDDCEMVAGGQWRLRASSPAYAALRAFVMTGAGTGGSCATTNVVGDAQLRVKYTDESGANQFRRPSDDVVAYLMNEMCGARSDFAEPFCPDIQLTFFCKETCDPNEDAVFTSQVRIGSARFHLGVQEQSECPQAEYDSCDVCWTSGSKTKPTSITLR